VGEQKKHMMLHYRAFINLFLDNQMVYTNSFVPQVPSALASCNRVAAFNILMQSTSRASSVFSEEALFNKAKKDVTNILKFMAEWCRICPSQTGRQPGQFIPSEPPSGKDRDWVFQNIMQTWWRTAQCLRIYKLRKNNSHLMENTPEAIRAALMSYNFAKRGVTSSEQRNFLTQAIPEDPENVYYQVNVETEAG
jgi:hypothetical protein